MLFEPDRRDEVVDVFLGKAYARLATPTETNQALAAAGEPTAPAQCSAVN